MPSSNPRIARDPWHGGRDFASADPERQREVVGYYAVRGAIETTPAPRIRGTATRTDWVRVQPDRESTNFEGSSSRHGR